MICRQCGTEIADKAIVCYRCGRATTDPVRKPAQIRRRRNPILTFVIVAVLILLALYLGQASRVAAATTGRVEQIVAIALGIVAVVILVFRMRR